MRHSYVLLCWWLRGQQRGRLQRVLWISGMRRAAARTVSASISISSSALRVGRSTLMACDGGCGEGLRWALRLLDATCTCAAGKQLVVGRLATCGASCAILCNGCRWRVMALSDIHTWRRGCGANHPTTTRPGHHSVRLTMMCRHRTNGVSAGGATTPTVGKRVGMAYAQNKMASRYLCCVPIAQPVILVDKPIIAKLHSE